MSNRLSKKFLVGVTLASLVAGSAALAESPRNGGPDGRRARLVEKFDTNKDGTLDESERAAMRAEREKKHEEMLQKFDANKDGKLDEAERQTAHEARAAEHFKALDKDGNGVLSLEEFKAGGLGRRGKHGRRHAGFGGQE
ncbi:EF-hand domain-containing protein [Pyxidicoccus sp. 3LG]